MKHSFKHEMDLEEARRKSDWAWEAYGRRFEKFSPSLEWIGDYVARIEFSAMGLRIKGALELKPRRINISLDAPPFFRIFKSRAITVIEKEIHFWMTQGKEGTR